MPSISIPSFMLFTRASLLFWLASRGDDDKQARLIKGDTAETQKSDPCAIRRPTRGAGEICNIRQLALLSVGHIQHPGRLQAGIVLPRRRIAGKRDTRAVRRPSRVAHRKIALENLLFLVSSDVPRPELRHLQIVFNHFGVVLVLGAFFLVLTLRLGRHQQQGFPFWREFTRADSRFVLRYLP